MYSEAINQHCLLVLITCCATAKKPAACRASGSSNLFPRDGTLLHLYIVTDSAKS